jgi:hypothetical protein
MHTDIRSITQQYFNKHTFDEVSIEEIEGFIEKYPYSATARYLLAQKIHNDEPENDHDELVTAGLYFHNPLWLDWLLNNREETIAEPETKHAEPAPETIADSSVAAVSAETETQPAVTDSPVVFQSYHTIDYFASQGIRLEAADLTKDKLGQQLKSFTEWLKSMKKLPKSEVERPREFDETTQQLVITNAAHSIEDKDITTEAMAEVWAKQGNTSKAIDIYNKLSLLDPTKSAYFAAKIEQLK